jgi:hypothetical protein
MTLLPSVDTANIAFDEVDVRRYTGVGSGRGVRCFRLEVLASRLYTG